MHITREEARRFVLQKQGLLGEHRFVGKQGALEYIRQAGCIQFDPVDVCGKMAELTLQSRVKGFAKKQLEELLYQDRALFDYPDKQLSIIPIEHWPFFERYRQIAREGGKSFEGLAEMEQQVLAFIQQFGPVSAEGLPFSGKMFWHSQIHWSGNWQGESNVARSVLEQLYSTGELVIHHKKGSRKYYDLADLHIPKEVLEAPEPLPDDFEHKKWRVLRRIGAAGIIWDKPSGFWNNVWELTTEERHNIFKALQEEGLISSLTIEGMRQEFFYLTADEPILKEVQSGQKYKARCEFIAPLDPFMWDKQLIKTLFDFEYGWEIYTPDVKRKFGAYVLPILYGDRFVGRIEAINDRKEKTLLIKNIWYEEDVRQTKAFSTALDRRINQFAKFNQCKQVIMKG